MDLAGKKLDEYVAITKTPILISITISVLGFVLGFIPVLGVVATLLVGLGGMVIGLLLVLYVGWTTVKSYNGGLVNSFIAGALFGLVTGLVGALLTLVSGIVVGGAAGAAIGIGLLIFAPGINAVFSGVVALIAGFVAGLASKKTTAK